VREEKRGLFQARLKEFQGAINAGRAPLLEGGIKYKPISINPVDSQMLQSRAFGVEQICRWFRVPPHMVGHTTNSTSWGTGLEEQKLGFLTFTLQRWLKRIEDECNRKLLSAPDRLRYFTEFNFEGLLRADSAARAAFYSTMTQNGIYTRDDCRIRENLAPMGGNANVLTVQSNLLPIDKLGATDPNAVAQNALKNWLGVIDPEPEREP
jgi:HK97 family phage portal protein